MSIVATLCYLFKDGKVLLIRKKRGIGTGKWNGPGGHVENGEDIADAAAREVREECGLIPFKPEIIGINEFYLGDKLEWIVHIFAVDEFGGTEAGSDEAEPEWFFTGQLPYDDMWHDDRFWMPLLLKRKKFKGRFYYDKDYGKLLEHNIEVLE